MYGPQILARSLSVAVVADSFGNRWQYHSRSDRHSKVACWALLFDLLRESPVLAEQARRGAIGFGINHEMRDFRTNRKKNLDLVICTQGSDALVRDSQFRALAEEYCIQLTEAEKMALDDLPRLRRYPVGSVHLALEAKACMTAHIKALPRLYDELNSSHAAIHGSADFAIAAGFVMVNLGQTFVSPDRNKHGLSRIPPDISNHAQPKATERTIAKLQEIPRRTQTNTEGFDALGIVVVRMANDGSPVTLVTEPPAPGPADLWHYEQLIRRLASLYATKFANL